MTATEGLRVSPQNFVNTLAAQNRSDETIQNLVHDLRQPLSAIEAIAYYLEMTLPIDQLDARRQLARLQELVCHSDAILSRAVGRT